MPKDITLSISPSEFNHPDGSQFSRGQCFVDFVLDRFSDDIKYIAVDQVIPADLRFEGPGKVPLNIEIKKAKYDKMGGDMMASLCNGHLAQQLIAIPSGEMGAVVVWGSGMDVFNSIDRTRLAASDVKRNWARYQEFKIEMWSNYNIPVMEIPELWGLHSAKQIQHPAKEMIKMGIAYFRGGGIIQYLNKNDGMEVGAGVLARVPTVGQETAVGLINFYGDAGHVVAAAKYPRELGEIKINGRKIGKKAEAIHQAFWGEAA
jgi:hypothetical protein